MEVCRTISQVHEQCNVSLPVTSFQDMLYKIRNCFTNIYHSKNVSTSSHFALGDAMVMTPWLSVTREWHRGAIALPATLKQEKVVRLMHPFALGILQFEAQIPILTLILKVKLILYSQGGYFPVSYWDVNLFLRVSVRLGFRLVLILVPPKPGKDDHHP